jgi:hypothetical protein
VTLLDSNEVPLVDVRLEPGFGTALYLPPSSGDKAFSLVEQEDGKPEQRSDVRRSNDAVVVALADAPSPSARGAKPFDLMFTSPFGPRAVAALPAEKQDAEVYGVSEDDRERMRNLLDTAADSARDQRIAGGVVGLSVGTIAAGFGIAALTSPIGTSVDTREGRDRYGEVALGLGAVGIGFGAYELLSRSTMEERRDAYVAVLKNNPRGIDAAVRDAELEIVARANSHRRWRTVASVISLSVGALALGGGITAEALTSDPDAKFPARALMGIGAGYIFVGTGTLFLRSEEERMADLWNKERALPSGGAHSGLRLSPRIGLGAVGLSGTF